MKRLVWKDLDADGRSEALARPLQRVDEQLQAKVRSIVEEVRSRAWGGVSVYTFLKGMSVQTVTADAASKIARPAALLARMEALEAHARAADARLEVAA